MKPRSGNETVGAVSAGKPLKGILKTTKSGDNIQSLRNVHFTPPEGVKGRQKTKHAPIVAAPISPGEIQKRRLRAIRFQQGGDGKETTNLLRKPANDITQCKRPFEDELEDTSSGSRKKRNGADIRVIDHGPVALRSSFRRGRAGIEYSGSYELKDINGVKSFSFTPGEGSLGRPFTEPLRRDCRYEGNNGRYITCTHFARVYGKPDIRITLWQIALETNSEAERLLRLLKFYQPAWN